MANPWLRLYSEFADDPKVQMMPESMQRRLVMLFCSRCKGETLHEIERAFQWRIDETELAKTKTLFLDKGFIDESWNLLNWNKRQYISDSSTERVRKHRQGKKQIETFPETHETKTETADTSERNAPRADTDTEQKKGEKTFSPHSDDPLECAREMFEHLAIVAPAKTLKLAAEAIRMQAAGLCTTPMKSMLLIRRRAELAMQAGEPVNAFWFEDSKWKSAPTSASVGVRKIPDCPICENRRMVVNEVGGTRMALQCECVTGPKDDEEAAETAPEGVDTELGARIWTGINKALKSAIPAQSYETWIRPIRPLGALNGELYLQIPSPDFAHVGDRYDIARFLPAGVEEIHLLSATGAAA